MTNMDVEFTLDFVAPKFPGIPPSKLQVQLCKNYNRKLLPSNETNIDRIWELRRKNNPKLYNGSKFRFHTIKAGSIGEDSCSVTFCLGLTGYKDFIGTNWADNAAELSALGKKDFANSQAYMADALGVSAFVQTQDDLVIFIRRSASVGEAQGLWDIPGGHPEPSVELFGRNLIISDL